MKEAGVMGRNLVASLSVRVSCMWLGAALLAFVLGMVSTPFLSSAPTDFLGFIGRPEKPGTVLQAQELVQGRHPAGEQQNTVFEDMNVLSTNASLSAAADSGVEEDDKRAGAGGERERKVQGPVAMEHSSPVLHRDFAGAGTKGSEWGVLDGVPVAPPPEPEPEPERGDVVSVVEELTPAMADGEQEQEPKLVAADRSCDLFAGEWVPDDQGPLYHHDSCPVLSGAQNCVANGRPDNGYLYWKWQPRDCTIPRLDPRAFLELLRGKTLAFVGDSVARNQMESLMCILMQVEKPANHGSRKMQRWYFRSYQVTVIRIWSSWLVHASGEAVDFAPEGLTKLFLQQVDEKFDDYLPGFDVLVLSSGHWFTKKTAFVMDNAVVGGQLWWEDGPGRNKSYDSAAAFAVAMRTALKRLVSHPGYKGVTILRTYSPDHYSGGEWNTGGSCTGQRAPLKAEEVYNSPYTAVMRKHQLDAYREAVEASAGGGITNGSKLRIMDVTPVFEYRADGHPGPYRNSDPNKKTKKGPDGRDPPQDCLHWCMPGPVDTWNVFLFEMLKQEFL